MKQKRQADQLILNKGKKAIKKSKDNLLINGADTILYSYSTRGKLQSITHTIHQKLTQHGLYIYM